MMTAVTLLLVTAMFVDVEAMFVSEESAYGSRGDSITSLKSLN
jgi:hypothetical protein